MRRATGTTPRRDRVVLDVLGEADVYSAASLRNQLAALVDAGATDIVVDLTAVTFIDSTGAGVLVGALRKVRPSGGTLQLVIDQHSVLRVFRIAGLTRLFTIHSTLESALAA